MGIRIPGRVTLAATTALLLLGCNRPAAKPDWRETQERWWVTSEVVYQSIIALLAARPAADAKGEEEVVRRIDSAIQDSLLLLDDQNSDDAMRSLVDLTSFYLGEASGEIFGCVVSRKGRRVMPFLEKALRDGGDSCAQDLGKGNDLCISAREGEGLSDRIHDLVARIEGDVPCTIER